MIARVVREPAGEAAGTIVLLHGRGADEHDLLPLLGVLDPKQRYRGITLGAPLTMPPGGKHWYAIYRIGWPDPATFAETLPALTQVLDDELGLDWSKTVIGGFSQASFFSYLAGSSVVFIEHFGLTPSAYSMVFASNAIALIGAPPHAERTARA